MMRGRDRLQALTAAALLLGATGCFTVGRDFPARDVPRIAIGETTREEIRQRFGAPWRTGLEDGQQTWTYAHYRYALLGEARTRDLVLRFDERGVVASYAFSSSLPEDRRLGEVAPGAR
jgi:hypothetical protein